MDVDGAEVAGIGMSLNIKSFLGINFSILRRILSILFAQMF